MSKVKYCLLLLAGLISLHLHAQHTIQGIVMDSSRDPIVGGPVKIKGTIKKTPVIWALAIP
ncbi:hypothetical protein [Chitinophaga ginsengisoli]|uniref:Carboxypeptidase family protein n=1 Tax=Chitinophaga ginsengisoli TaxID=363837 RepID=A0A2P8G512_9BACT|nr:hypothetical protein [Chitinophaga ginsengisoli]PSL29026.1 hypothetical protein CLV42_107172 [Chitinophaga ginsengisoli]